MLDEEDEFPEEAVDEIFDDLPEPTTVAEEASGKVSAEAIKECVEKMKALFDDGFQAMDILHGLGLGMEVMELVGTMTPGEKEAAVVSALKEAYEDVNPDLISWVPNWIERKALFWLLDSFGPALVQWACKLTKGEYAINAG